MGSESTLQPEPIALELEKTKPKRFLRNPLIPSDVPPPKESLDDAELIPEANANFWNLLTFGWITGLLAVGYVRPLQAPDLYKLQDHRASAIIADKLTKSFDRRHAEAEAYNVRLASGEIKPGWRALWWTVRGNRAEREKKWRETDGRRKASLILAMNDSVKWWFWTGGFMKLTSDIATVMSPLLVKALINFSTNSYDAHLAGDPQTAPPIGEGIGLAFALLALQLLSSLCTHHFFYRATSTGVLLRGGLIAAIYDRSLRLSSRARTTLTNGKLVNHISTDVSRIDFCCGFMQMSITAPIQMVICLIVLLVNLGPSALAGYAFFVLCTPLQSIVMTKLGKLRQKSMIWTDKRVKLLQELLGGMKIIKYFAWEVPYLARIEELRVKEMSYIRTLLLYRSANNAVAISLPALASVLSFVVYSLTGHSLDPATIFSSLTLFQILRMPLMFLPVSLGSIVDAVNASERLYHVFVAETLTDLQEQDVNMDAAIEAVDAAFTWDSAPPEAEKKKKGSNGGKGKSAITVTEKSADEKQESVFHMQGINLTIPKGQLTAIIGPVGSGKTSLLEGLIGEMRRTSGSVKFNGSIAYCPQSAWIQNATVRENICFGRPFDEVKYNQAIRDACLEHDLELLPHGDMTEVGERGISLSGGQKQRINICRAIYVGADIQIFDDPLSALDAHVGKAVFQNVFRNTSEGKTKVLVTHALHFLPQVDYIYTIMDGKIKERGTYAELMANQGDFCRFVEEFGTKDSEVKEEESKADDDNADDKVDDVVETKVKKAVVGKSMMQEEERSTGAVNKEVYREYLKAGDGYIIVPILIVSIALLQGCQVMSSYWLVYWQEMKWPEGQGFYMGIYAGLGVAQAVTFFMMAASFAIITFLSGSRLHSAAMKRVMYAPMSFYETTPLGRIMNRFAKDIDTIDNMLGDSMRMFVSTFSNILGAIILIAIVLPWFLIAVFAISVVYVWAAIFYRASARELKRIDAILRSSLYSHFSESLSGLATIRAYGESSRFKCENLLRIDIENRAYWMTVTNQRWLGIRLDFCGIMLTFIVALLTVGTRFSISPSQTGVVLSYIISIQQAFGWMVRQTAEVENNFNSVERIVYYSTRLEQEPPHDVPDDNQRTELWPSRGAIEFKDVVMKYRPELPAVLKGLDMLIRPGEKIGIVGRTGAGKSSIMTALYRLVELTSGEITIDGRDISAVGLTKLRNGLAIIPQDPLLFSGTLRTNLDPFGNYDDARLWDALKRAYLVEDTKRQSIDIAEDDEVPGTRSPPSRFSLDSVVEAEGGNLSIGQRSLVSLARALVKNTRILILDEATASVDYETDRKIQDTIASEFQDRTILCIAHRLRTIIGYDRICVLDAGNIAEFDSPANLYNAPQGIFRSMCDRSSITLEDIRLARKVKDE